MVLSEMRTEMSAQNFSGKGLMIMNKKIMKTALTFGLLLSVFAVCGEKTEASKEMQTDQAFETEMPDRRVIADSVAVVEILDELGIPMVGVPTSEYDLPDSAADAVRIGSAMTPDMEIVASLDADVFVSVESLKDSLDEQLKQLGLECIYVNLDSYDGLLEAVQTLGGVFGEYDRAEALTAELEGGKEEILASVEGKESPTVLIIFGAGTSFMVCSEDTYVGSIAKAVGAVNVIQDAVAAYSPVDMEYLAAMNPDYILLMAHASPEESLEALDNEFSSNEAWQNFDAVKEGRIVTLPIGTFGMSANLEAAEAMEQMAQILYPEE